MSKAEIEQAVAGLVEQEPDQVDLGIGAEAYDANDLMDKWQDATDEALDEVKSIERLATTIGYDSLEYFLSDNPGCMSAIVEWITEWLDRVPEWKEALMKDIVDEGGTLPEPVR